MTEISDLEKVLLKAAAESDSRNYEVHEEKEKVEEANDYTRNREVLNRDNEEQIPDKNRETSHKRPIEDDDYSSVSKKSRTYGNIIATHYNQLKEKGLDERSKSRIFHLKNFHNWVKSMLINEYLTKIKEGKKYNAPIRVHDMCCGKGGDLLKWKKGGITHLICSDIASVSLEQCKARYTEMKSRSSRDRSNSNIYAIEYIVGDATRLRLREKFFDPSLKLNLVSCQFSFHYCFESLPQAECMLRNAAECLQPGGYFIGTTLDAYDLIARAKKCGSTTYGNRVYKVELDFDLYKPPLFGAKYHFNLDEAVNCPEFLVHFPTLVKLAKKFGLKLVKKEKFFAFFERMKNEGRQLLFHTRSLEAYPSNDFNEVNDEYIHADEFIKKEGKPNVRVGTLSKSEWEASTLYTTFVFEKVKNTWNTDGTPIYDI